MLETYFYTGYSQNGSFKAGFERDINISKVRENLKNRKIFIRKIIKISFLSRKQKPQDIIILFTQCRMFIKNGYSFSKILEILEENINLRSYTENMKESLKKGESLYEIFKNSGIILKNSELMIIKSGEQSGNIYDAFEKIEDGIKRRENIKKETMRIMVYPVTVLIMTTALILFMGLYILPGFIKIIEDSSQELPLITKLIIWFAEKTWIIIFLISGLVSAVIYIFKNQKTKEKLFQNLIKINIFKVIIDKIFISNFTNNLEVLLASGVTITETIELIKDEEKYNYFKIKLENAENELKKGNSIYFSFKNMEIFSKIDLELIRAGEESGELVNTFQMIALKTGEDLKQKTDICIKLLEPLSMVILGIIVGGIFFGVYLPVFQMMDSI